MKGAACEAAPFSYLGCIRAALANRDGALRPGHSADPTVGGTRAHGEWGERDSALRLTMCEADMNRQLLASVGLGVCALAGCGNRQPILPSAEPPSTFQIRRGDVRDFGTQRPICLDAFDQETGADLTAIAMKELSARLPGISNACDVRGPHLAVTFQTGLTVYTHSSERGPRFGVAHVGVESPRGDWIAEAELWDDAGGRRDDVIKRLARRLALLLQGARHEGSARGPRIDSRRRARSAVT